MLQVTRTCGLAPNSYHPWAPPARGSRAAVSLRHSQTLRHSLQVPPVQKWPWQCHWDTLTHRLLSRVPLDTHPAPQVAPLPYACPVSPTTGLITNLMCSLLCVWSKAPLNPAVIR